MDLIYTPRPIDTEAWSGDGGGDGDIEVIGRPVAEFQAVRSEAATTPTHRRRVMFGLLVLTMVVDVIAVYAAYVGAKALHVERWELGSSLLTPVDSAIFLTVLAWPVVFGMYGLYDFRRSTHIATEARQLFQAVIFSVLLVVLVAFGLRLNISRGFIIGLLLTSMCTTITGRLLVRRINHALNARLITSQRTIIVGCNDEGRSMARSLARRRWMGFDVCGFIDVTHSGMEEVDGLPVVGWVDTIREAAGRLDARVAIVAGSAVGTGMLQQIDDALSGLDISVRVSSGLSNLAASRAAVEPLDGIALFTLQRRRFSARARILKRVLDVTVATTMLVITSPLLLVVALLVRLTSRGPVLFRQERVGEEGRTFMMCKFRTMVDDAETLREALHAHNEAGGLLFKMHADPRVTGVGRWLRRFAIDELPQLFNVLRGEMSLVGPRPALPEETLNYDERLRRRLRVKPGLTGLWQVNGRHQLAFEDYVQYDLFYVENWSVMMDLYILARTVPTLIAARGSY